MPFVEVDNPNVGVAHPFVNTDILFANLDLSFLNLETRWTIKNEPHHCEIHSLSTILHSNICVFVRRPATADWQEYTPLF